MGLVSPSSAEHAIGGGHDVYFFLAGILALAELARVHGVFAWLSVPMLRYARGSQARLFTLVFAIGAVLTALLSNDTTIIVLTPAMIVVLGRTNVAPLPYLYACAFVASAASYVLPISNPANLLLYIGGLPTLAPWLAIYGPSAIVAILATFAALFLAMRTPLRARLVVTHTFVHLSPAGFAALATVVASALALLVANATGFPVGMTALACAAVAVCAVAFLDRRTPLAVARGVSWGIIPLVAGLFVVVAALDRAGALGDAQHLLATAARLPSWSASLAVAAATALACNLFNNLPVALFAGAAIHGVAVPTALSHTVLVAVDLSPSLSLTGSLATLLWLIVLRREGIIVTPWQFVRLGAVVTLPALLLAVAVVR